MKYPGKSLIKPERVRNIPGSFSWIDRRFIQEGYVMRLSPEALLLYFFLATVGDRYGLSFYGDRTIRRLLKMHHEALERARGRLIEEDLIAYQPPLYQVLSLKDLPTWGIQKTDKKDRVTEPVRINTIRPRAKEF